MNKSFPVYKLQLHKERGAQFGELANRIVLPETCDRLPRPQVSDRPGGRDIIAQTAADLGCEINVARAWLESPCRRSSRDEFSCSTHAYADYSTNESRCAKVQFGTSDHPGRPAADRELEDYRKEQHR
jgi:hypothetical protein